jgi:hypothetical protein
MSTGPQGTEHPVSQAGHTSGPANATEWTQHTGTVFILDRSSHAAPKACAPHPEIPRTTGCRNQIASMRVEQSFGLVGVASGVVECDTVEVRLRASCRWCRLSAYWPGSCGRTAFQISRHIPAPDSANWCAAGLLAVGPRSHRARMCVGTPCFS